MSHRAWIYVWGVLLVGTVLSGLALTGLAPSTSQCLTFAAFTALAIIVQLLEAQAPGRQSYYPHLVVFFAGVLLLDPFLFVLLAAIPHLVEWATKRLQNSPLLREWYIQPFNIATHIIAGSGARLVHTTLGGATPTFLTPSSVVAMTTAAVTYVILNHGLVGLALVLARRLSWRESGILEIENLLTDLILLCLGSIVAVVWRLNPWLIVPALTPLVLIYRALMVPQLKQQAQVDAKTDLWNARHFSELLTTEMRRARRFDRPLALIMADLDILRNINNTYGHLAGDAVLAGIGQIIRETIREYDIAGRFGGDEFCVVLVETGPTEARSIAERLRQAVEDAGFDVETTPTPIRATTSLGVACFPGDATTPTDLIHEADVAVYQAKLKGGNCVVWPSDVPHSIRLEAAAAEDHPVAPHAITFTPRPKIAGDDERPDTDALTTRNQGKRQAYPANAAGNHPQASSWLFLGGSVAAGVVVTMLGFTRGAQPDLRGIGLLIVLALIAEILHVTLYEANTLSVSVAANFAAGLIAGMPGVAFVSGAIALTHYFRARPALFKTAFNWSTHVLAGLAPVLTVSLLAIPLEISSLPLLAVVNGVAALAYYVIETGLLATAVSLWEGNSFMTTWRERFQWLAGHYLVLCVMGLLLSVAYVALGLVGVIVFALPVFMMRYTQQQYIDRTEDSVQELRRMYDELQLANQEIVTASQALRRLNEELFLTLAKVIDARDPYVYGHTSKVADYATAIAIELGLTAECVEFVREAAFLHDIGKIAIADRVLNKPGKLTDEEYEHVKTHSARGAELLETCQSLRPLVPIVRHHHERWDGTGYPDGLRGRQIPLESCILALCDAVDAMASDRPYRGAMSLSEIITEIRRCSGTQFEPAVAEAFVRVVQRKGDCLIVNSAGEVQGQHFDAAARVLQAKGITELNVV